MFVYDGKYETIEKIVNSTLSIPDKMWYIEMFVKGWYEAKDIEWIFAKKDVENEK